MEFNNYIYTDGKKLRMGYTTGTCAALAAGGACEFLLTGNLPKTLRIMTPKGIEVVTEPADSSQTLDIAASVAVRKDAGDDYDVTQGMLVYATAYYTGAKDGKRVFIEGGEGVGKVTKPGLDQPVGNAAINSTPRTMIENQVLEVLENYDFAKNLGIRIVISVPDGEEIAKKTLNSSLGIEGGISIIGTSGIVEPMSKKAYSDSVRVEIKQKLAEGCERLILTPGNYGMSYLADEGYDDINVPVVMCSNFIGDALDEAIQQGVQEVIIIGHIGKTIKLCGGITNTHSSVADGRMEIFTSHAAIAGASREVCQSLMNSVTTDACIEILDKAGLREEVMNSLLKRADRYLDYYVRKNIKVGLLMFSNVYGTLGMSDVARGILENWQNNTGGEE